MEVPPCPFDDVEEISCSGAPIGVAQNIMLAEAAMNVPVKLGRVLKRPAAATCSEIAPAPKKKKTSGSDAVAPLAASGFVTALARNKKKPSGSEAAPPAAAIGSETKSAEAAMVKLDAAFRRVVERTVHKCLWPTNVSKEGALSYTVRSTCGASLCIRCSKDKLSFSATCERSCTAKGNNLIRKTMKYPLRPSTGFHEWWHAVRAVICQCDEGIAWVKFDAD